MPLHAGVLKVLHAQPHRRVVKRFCNGVAKDFESSPRLVEPEKCSAHVVARLGKISAIITWRLGKRSRHTADEHGHQHYHN